LKDIISFEKLQTYLGQRNLRTMILFWSSALWISRTS